MLNAASFALHCSFQKIFCITYYEYLFCIHSRFFLLSFCCMKQISFPPYEMDRESLDFWHLVTRQKIWYISCCYAVATKSCSVAIKLCQHKGGTTCCKKLLPQKLSDLSFQIWTFFSSFVFSCIIHFLLHLIFFHSTFILFWLYNVFFRLYNPLQTRILKNTRIYPWKVPSLHTLLLYTFGGNDLPSRADAKNLLRYRSIISWEMCWVPCMPAGIVFIRFP